MDFHFFNLILSGHGLCEMLLDMLTAKGKTLDSTDKPSAEFIISDVEEGSEIYLVS